MQLTRNHVPLQPTLQPTPRITTARRKPTPLLVLWSPFAQQTTTPRPPPHQQPGYRRGSSTIPPPPKPPVVPEAPPPAGLSWRLGVKYAELLNLQPNTTNPSDVVRQCDAHATRPLHPAYPPHVHAGVTSLLDRVRMMMQGAGDKAASLYSYVNVEPSLLPSVIALLHHVGANDMVLQLGTDAMRLDGIDVRRNVALSVALAYTTRAAQQTDVVLAYEALQKARNVLATVGDPFAEVSRDLQGKCAALQPLFVLEMLKKTKDVVEHNTTTLMTTSEQRAAALAMLRTLLLQPPTPPKTTTTAQYALQALQTLTAAEITSLLNWTLVSGLGNAWASPMVLRHVALAHMAMGVANRHVGSIKTAFLLLDGINKTQDVFAEKLCCYTLLGNGRQCSKMLQRDYIRTRLLAGYLAGGGGDEHLAPARQPLAYDPDNQPIQLPARDKIVDFVRFESREGDWNIVPGICLFVQLFVTATVLPRFPELQLQGADDALRARLHRLEQQLPAIGFSATNPFAGLDAWEVVVGVGKAVVAGWKRMVVGLAGLVAAMWNSVGAVGGVLSRVLHSRMLPRVLKSITLGAAAVMVVACAQTMHIPSIPNPFAPLSKYVHSLAPSSVPRTQQFLDFGTAERLVHNWQIAKAHVLGKRRDLGLLNKVTVDPLAAFMAKNTAANAHKGWYFDYRLLDCKVTRVEHDALRDGSIRVLALVHERCDMRGVDGRKASGYKDRYAIEYRVVPWEDGTWRIKSFDVVGAGGV